MAIFLISTSETAGPPIEVSSGKVLLFGRSSTADIVVENSQVSGKHVEIEFSDNQFLIIKDLNTTNGSFLNDDRILVSKMELGDTLKIGPYEYIIDPSRLTEEESVLLKNTTPVVKSDDSKVLEEYPEEFDIDIKDFGITEVSQLDDMNEEELTQLQKKIKLKVKSRGENVNQLFKSLVENKISYRAGERLIELDVDPDEEVNIKMETKFQKQKEKFNKKVKIQRPSDEETTTPGLVNALKDFLNKLT